MKLCLNMIVRNEGARIERCLASAAPFIDSWVIVDTGSTDDTKQKIVDFFRARGIIGEIRDEPFIDWGQARNAALDWARKLAFAYQPEYFLLMDADMELVVKDPGRWQSHRSGPAYDLYQVGGSMHYLNRRLVHANVVGSYRGVTHEYLDIPTAGTVDETVAFFVDHADGANRPDKFKRDIRLLKEGLRAEPTNERYFFYLACSYRDAGQPEKALRWFKRRVEAGGWDEEVWQAQVNLAHCRKDVGDEAGFIRELLVAYDMRPSRPESMYDLARYYRDRGMNAPALAAAEAVEHLPPSRDSLFVNDYVHKVGIRQEIGIAAYYVPGKRRKGYETCAALCMDTSPYTSVREEARNNIYHYVEPLASFCPSFQWQRIGFEPPENWIAMNPSVTTHNGSLWCNVRCVNYRIDEEGRYLIRGTDGTITAENPINTRNFLLELGVDPFRPSPLTARELLPPGNLPCEFPLVVGFEDVRIFSTGPEMWSSATVRQIHPDGNCEQVLTHLVGCDGRARGRSMAYRQTDMQRMLREPRQTEKNWAPIASPGAPITFMWRPLEVVGTDGKTIHKADPGAAVDNISGSSQLLPFRIGWLAITHEARQIPGRSTRHYTHRFVWYNEAFTTCQFSLPFYFNEKGIEFCAGLTEATNGADLVISYGYKDEEARIATVSASEVEQFLWTSSKRSS